MLSVKKAALVALLILLGAGHVAYWYVPREHAATLAAENEVGAVLAHDDLPLRVWFAYPHQNLAFVAGSEGGERWREGLAEMLGVPTVELPAFGPFALPPANEMAVATDFSGDRMVAAARVYPGVALFARAAGMLADNPWLSGGEVVQAGRRFEVTWEGRTWIVRSQGERWPEPERAATGADPALARFGFGRPVGPMPAGAYKIRRNGEHLDLMSDGLAPRDVRRPEAGVLLLADHRDGLRGMAVLGPGEGSLRGVPSAISFALSPAKPAELPFERLYDLLGIDRQAVSDGNWEVVASDEAALERGLQLQRTVSRSPPNPGDLVVTADLDVVRAATDELEAQLEGVPLRGLKELRQWRGAAMILSELGAYDAWSLEMTAGGREVRSRLWRAP